MGSRLKDNRSSGYFEAYNKLKFKEERREVLVYVEDIDDVPFWRRLFSKHETDSLKFKVCPPDGPNIRRGKPNVLTDEDGELRANWGKFLLGCVDSDYHYLLPEQSEQAALINCTPYIFQTYTYSIENYKCYSSALKELVIDITKVDKELINLEEFIKQFSIIIYPLFIRMVYFLARGDKASFTENELKGKISAVFKDCKLSDYGIKELDELKDVTKRAIEELERLKSIDSSVIIQLEDELFDSGVTEENCYLFINGHILFNNVILEILNTICLRIRKEYIDSLKSMANNGIEIGKRVKQYDSCTGLDNKKLKDMLRDTLSNNYNFTDCFLYKNIEADIERYIESHFQAGQ